MKMPSIEAGNTLLDGIVHGEFGEGGSSANDARVLLRRRQEGA